MLRYTNRHNFDGYQVLVRETRLFGVRIWSREIDREEVPSWASIQRATLGYTDWRSRFAQYIG